MKFETYEDFVQSFGKYPLRVNLRANQNALEPVWRKFETTNWPDAVLPTEFGRPWMLNWAKEFGYTKFIFRRGRTKESVYIKSGITNEEAKLRLAVALFPRKPHVSKQ